MVLNTILTTLSKEDILNTKELIKNISGTVKMVQPGEEKEKYEDRTVTFRCKCSKTGNILNTPLVEIGFPFTK